MNQTVIKLEGEKIGKEIERLENTLHGANSKLQGQTAEANNRVKVSGAGQGGPWGVKATNVELMPWMCGEIWGFSLSLRDTGTNSSALGPAGKETSELTHHHFGFQTCLSPGL